MFLYLVTREVPAEFRLFLLRHADLLKTVNQDARWPAVTFVRVELCSTPCKVLRASLRPRWPTPTRLPRWGPRGRGASGP